MEKDIGLAVYHGFKDITDYSYLSSDVLFVGFCLEKIGIPMFTVELERWMLCDVVTQSNYQILAYQCIMIIDNTSPLFFAG